MLPANTAKVGALVMAMKVALLTEVSARKSKRLT